MLYGVRLYMPNNFFAKNGAWCMWHKQLIGFVDIQTDDINLAHRLREEWEAASIKHGSYKEQETFIVEEYKERI